MTFTKGYWLNPLQNIKPSFSFPHGNIFMTDTCLKSIAEVNTAVTALYAFESFRGHEGPLFEDYGYGKVFCNILYNL